MATRAPRRDIDESEVEVHHQKEAAAGVTAVAVSMKRSIEQMGFRRSAQTLLRLNQAKGFDCPSCAWPDPLPQDRKVAEFCENGAKAVAEEATLRRVDPVFFADHPVSELAERSDYWLGQQGRITHPMVKRSGSDRYVPIDWDDAFALIADHLNALDDPDQAVFYTSGRASNEAAFAYQLFVRAFGTNNLPDCSNMCHESTSVALAEAIGIGKASVTYADVVDAGLIVIAGQNPGTNHPRMLTALEEAKANGAKILAINPLREAGLMRFKNPQNARGLAGAGTGLADEYLPVRVNGDLALFQAFGHLLIKWGVGDRDFVARHTAGYQEWADHVTDLDWDAVRQSTGLSREQIEQAARMIADSPATVYCWAMGLTQHRNAVATIKEIVNLSLLQGGIGRPGAGLMPVRGHSNVQGDRTMGIWEKVPDHFLDALGAEFGFQPPREHGYDTVDSIRAMRDGKAHVFFGLGGNFVSATPDTEVTSMALRSTALTVHVSTKLNRSHTVCGDTALILPTLGRTEKDIQASGPQRVTVEDTVCNVHASHGPLDPASDQLRSEVAIVTGLAQATLRDDQGRDRYGIDWAAMREDYRVIRQHISRVVPGCEAYAEKVDRPGGFFLPHPPRDTRTFPTKINKAMFTVSPTEVLQVPPGRLLLQTLRSHDQFNTTIYGLDDRYRGVSGGRQVVFMHPDDIAAHGFDDGDLVDLVSEWADDDIERRVRGFRIVSYDQPRGCAAAYYPETNPLVPLDSTAIGSNCPVSKAVIISVERSTGDDQPVTHRAGQSSGTQDRQGADRGHKSDVEPTHLS